MIRMRSTLKIFSRKRMHPKAGPTEGEPTLGRLNKIMTNRSV